MFGAANSKYKCAFERKTGISFNNLFVEYPAAEIILFAFTSDIFFYFDL